MRHTGEAQLFVYLAEGWESAYGIILICLLLPFFFCFQSFFLIIPDFNFVKPLQIIPHRQFSLIQVTDSEVVSSMIEKEEKEKSEGEKKEGEKEKESEK